jgi:xylose isomerase
MAAEMIEDGVLPKFVDDRYAGWKTPENQAILKGERSLEDLAKLVDEKNINPSPRSGRQEYLENLVNRYL